MSNSITAISDDMDTYKWLCQKYNETPQYTNGMLDCYGEHVNELKQRHIKLRNNK